MTLAEDKLYSGWYTRPVRQGKKDKKKTAKVELTRSPQEVKKLIEDLEDSDQTKIMKAIFPFRYRKHLED